MVLESVENPVFREGMQNVRSSGGEGIVDVVGAGYQGSATCGCEVEGVKGKYFAGVVVERLAVGVSEWS